MINKLLKSFLIFLIVLGISFSNIPFNGLSFLVDSYEKTDGIVDKIWLVQQNRSSDVVDKFVSLRNISDKLRIHEAHASTFVAVSNYNSSGTASALVNKPAGTANNDIMFALIMRNNNGAVNSVPAGWNLIANHQYSTTYHQMLYWKLAAGEGASYTWGFASSGKTAITIATYRGGFDTANPIDVVSNTEFITTPSTTVRAASMNVTSPNSSLIWFGTIYSTTVRTWTKPAIPTTGWVENYDGGATSSDFSRTIDSMVWTGSGATGNMDGTVVTGGTTVKHAFAVALRPPPSANNPPSLVVSQPDGVGDTVNVGDLYNITYTLSDAEDVVTAAFYYDIDGSGLNGTAISGACAAAPEGTNATCSWNTTGVAPGTYYVYGIVNDGFNPQVNDYSPGIITINAPAPVVNGIDPVFGLNTENNKTISFVTGNNFQAGATVKLTKGASTINQLTAFTFNPVSGYLENGSFNLLGQPLGVWDVVVTNPDLQVGTCGGCFEIRSSLPSVPANIYQFKTNTDIAEPPMTNIAVGGGIGGQTNVYFRMNISGGLTGALNPYTPQVEVKQIGTPFDGLPGSISSGSEVVYDGITPVIGWVNVIGLQDGTSYHWRARASNSAGQSAWVSFGGNIDRDPQPSDIDIYIDNTPPVIFIGTDNTCATAALSASITDLNAIIQWNTSDATSGAESVFPNSGTWAKGQVDYKKGIEPWSSTSLSAWENSPHQVTLSGLTQATTYTFRIRAQDYVGNEAVSSECTFLTSSSRPIKTVEFFIDQETFENVGGIPNRIAKDFSIYLPESPGESVSIKSAFIEIGGISSSGTQAVNVELRRGFGAVFVDPGSVYNIDSTGTTTPFTILFDALSPGTADGNQSMADIVQGATTYPYTLFLSNTSGVNVSVYSAKLIITYSYVQ